jgi:hypothetical protein
VQHPRLQPAGHRRLPGWRGPAAADRHRGRRRARDRGSLTTALATERTRLRIAVLALAVAGALAGCRHDGGAATGGAAATRSGWDPAALASAAALAEAIRTAGLACDGYEVWDHGSILRDYAEKLPMPAAMATCAGAGGEDLTFEVFADRAARDRFMVTKMQRICTTAASQGLKFPGLPFVQGDAWVIEPDDEATARRLAEALHAAAQLATCP